VLGTTAQLGVQIYQFGFSPLVVLFFRHADGYEEPLPNQDLAWRATDGEDVAAGSGVWPTDFGGGVFLYPADARRSYREGRLRLLYEAHPIALIMEWAGGAASTGRDRVR